MTTIKLGGNHYRRINQLCHNDCTHCKSDEDTCIQGCEGCAVGRDKPICEQIQTAYGRPCGYHMWEAMKTMGIPGSAEQEGFGF